MSNNWGNVHWLSGGRLNQSFAASTLRVQASSSDIKQSLLPPTPDLCGTMSPPRGGPGRGDVESQLRPPPNAVKDFLRRNRGVSSAPYAEGVIFRSPGSAEPRSGGAPPWVRVLYSSVTPKALYKGSTACSFLWNAFGVRVLWAIDPGCAANHGCAAVPATLGFGVQPLRGKENAHSKP
jgi:hypothetical protein